MGKPLSFLASDGTRMSCLLICATTAAAAAAKARATDGRPLRCALHFFCLCPGQKSLQASSVSSAALFLLLCRALQQ
ncbi:unnamed protein product [Sphagnum troendelagicum]|uniref:Secreted protein n=1 Tax=Sphagnum troendelagicum TaxID=128251 RepID=A0ABP0U286_9BRYO